MVLLLLFVLHAAPRPAAGFLCPMPEYRTRTQEPTASVVRPTHTAPLSRTHLLTTSHAVTSTKAPLHTPSRRLTPSQPTSTTGSLSPSATASASVAASISLSPRRSATDTVSGTLTASQTPSAATASASAARNTPTQPTRTPLPTRSLTQSVSFALSASGTTWSASIALATDSDAVASASASGSGTQSHASPSATKSMAVSATDGALSLSVHHTRSPAPGTGTPSAAGTATTQPAATKTSRRTPSLAATSSRPRHASRTLSSAIAATRSAAPTRTYPGPLDIIRYRTMFESSGTIDITDDGNGTEIKGCTFSGAPNAAAGALRNGSAAANATLLLFNATAAVASSSRLAGPTASAVINASAFVHAAAIYVVAFGTAAAAAGAPAVHLAVTHCSFAGHAVWGAGSETSGALLAVVGVLPQRSAIEIRGLSLDFAWSADPSVPPVAPVCTRPPAAALVAALLLDHLVLQRDAQVTVVDCSGRMSAAFAAQDARPRPQLAFVAAAPSLALGPGTQLAVRRNQLALTLAVSSGGMAAEASCGAADRALLAAAALVSVRGNGSVLLSGIGSLAAVLAIEDNALTAHMAVRQTVDSCWPDPPAALAFVAVEDVALSLTSRTAQWAVVRNNATLSVSFDREEGLAAYRWARCQSAADGRSYALSRQRLAAMAGLAFARLAPSSLRLSGAARFECVTNRFDAVLLNSGALLGPSMLAFVVLGPQTAMAISGGSALAITRNVAHATDADPWLGRARPLLQKPQRHVLTWWCGNATAPCQPPSLSHSAPRTMAFIAAGSGTTIAVAGALSTVACAGNAHAAEAYYPHQPVTFWTTDGAAIDVDTSGTVNITANSIALRAGFDPVTPDVTDTLNGDPTQLAAFLEAFGPALYQPRDLGPAVAFAFAGPAAATVGGVNTTTTATPPLGVVRVAGGGVFNVSHNVVAAQSDGAGAVFAHFGRTNVTVAGSLSRLAIDSNTATLSAPMSFSFTDGAGMAAYAAALDAAAGNGSYAQPSTVAFVVVGTSSAMQAQGRAAITISDNGARSELATATGAVAVCADDVNMSVRLALRDAAQAKEVAGLRWVAGGAFFALLLPGALLDVGDDSSVAMLRNNMSLVGAAEAAAVALAGATLRVAPRALCDVSSNAVSVSVAAMGEWVANTSTALSPLAQRVQPLPDFFVVIRDRKLCNMSNTRSMTDSAPRTATPSRMATTSLTTTLSASPSTSTTWSLSVTTSPSATAGSPTRTAVATPSRGPSKTAALSRRTPSPSQSTTVTQSYSVTPSRSAVVSATKTAAATSTGTATATRAPSVSRTPRHTPTAQASATVPGSASRSPRRSRSASEVTGSTEVGTTTWTDTRVVSRVVSVTGPDSTSLSQSVSASETAAATASTTLLPSPTATADRSATSQSARRTATTTVVVTFVSRARPSTTLHSVTMLDTTSDTASETAVVTASATVLRSTSATADKSATTETAVPTASTSLTLRTSESETRSLSAPFTRSQSMNATPTENGANTTDRRFVASSFLEAHAPGEAASDVAFNEGRGRGGLPLLLPRMRQFRAFLAASTNTTDSPALVPVLPNATSGSAYGRTSFVALSCGAAVRVQGGTLRLAHSTITITGPFAVSFVSVGGACGSVAPAAVARAAEQWRPRARVANVSSLSGFVYGNTTAPDDWADRAYHMPDDVGTIANHSGLVPDGGVTPFDGPMPSASTISVDGGLFLCDNITLSLTSRYGTAAAFLFSGAPSTASANRTGAALTGAGLLLSNAAQWRVEASSITVAGRGGAAVFAAVGASIALLGGSVMRFDRSALAANTPASYFATSGVLADFGAAAAEQAALEWRCPLWLCPAAVGDTPIVAATATAAVPVWASGAAHVLLVAGGSVWTIDGESNTSWSRCVLTASRPDDALWYRAVAVLEGSGSAGALVAATMVVQTPDVGASLPCAAMLFTGGSALQVGESCQWSVTHSTITVWNGRLGRRGDPAVLATVGPATAMARNASDTDAAAIAFTGTSRLFLERRALFAADGCVMAVGGQSEPSLAVLDPAIPHVTPAEREYGPFGGVCVPVLVAGQARLLISRRSVFSLSTNALQPRCGNGTAVATIVATNALPLIVEHQSLLRISGNTADLAPSSTGGSRVGTTAGFAGQRLVLLQLSAACLSNNYVSGVTYLYRLATYTWFTGTRLLLLNNTWLTAAGPAVTGYAHNSVLPTAASMRDTYSLTCASTVDGVRAARALTLLGAEPFRGSLAPPCSDIVDYQCALPDGTVSMSPSHTLAVSATVTASVGSRSSSPSASASPSESVSISASDSVSVSASGTVTDGSVTASPSPSASTSPSASPSASPSPSVTVSPSVSLSRSRDVTSWCERISMRRIEEWFQRSLQGPHTARVRAPSNTTYPVPVALQSPMDVTDDDIRRGTALVSRNITLPIPCALMGPIERPVRVSLSYERMVFSNDAFAADMTTPTVSPSPSLPNAIGFERFGTVIVPANFRSHGLINVTLPPIPFYLIDLPEVLVLRLSLRELYYCHDDAFFIGTLRVHKSANTSLAAWARTGTAIAAVGMAVVATGGYSAAIHLQALVALGLTRCAPPPALVIFGQSLRLLSPIAVLKPLSGAAMPAVGDTRVTSAVLIDGHAYYDALAGALVGIVIVIAGATAVQLALVAAAHVSKAGFSAARRMGHWWAPGITLILGHSFITAVIFCSVQLLTDSGGRHLLRAEHGGAYLLAGAIGLAAVAVHVLVAAIVPFCFLTFEYHDLVPASALATTGVVRSAPAAQGRAPNLNDFDMNIALDIVDHSARALDGSNDMPGTAPASRGADNRGVLLRAFSAACLPSGIVMPHHVRRRFYPLVSAHRTSTLLHAARRVWRRTKVVQALGRDPTAALAKNRADMARAQEKVAGGWLYGSACFFAVAPLLLPVGLGLILLIFNERAARDPLLVPQPTSQYTELLVPVGFGSVQSTQASARFAAVSANRDWSVAEKRAAFVGDVAPCAAFHYAVAALHALTGLILTLLFIGSSRLQVVGTAAASALGTACFIAAAGMVNDPADSGLPETLLLLLTLAMAAAAVRTVAQWLVWYADYRLSQTLKDFRADTTHERAGVDDAAKSDDLALSLQTSGASGNGNDDGRVLSWCGLVVHPLRCWYHRCSGEHGVFGTMDERYFTAAARQRDRNQRFMVDHTADGADRFTPFVTAQEVPDDVELDSFSDSDPDADRQYRAVSPRSLSLPPSAAGGPRSFSALPPPPVRLGRAVVQGVADAASTTSSPRHRQQQSPSRSINFNDV